MSGIALITSQTDTYMNSAKLQKYTLPPCYTIKYIPVHLCIHWWNVACQHAKLWWFLGQGTVGSGTGQDNWRQ